MIMMRKYKDGKKILEFYGDLINAEVAEKETWLNEISAFSVHSAVNK